MLPVGPKQAKDHTVINDAIKLFCILKSILITVLDNASYRKASCDGCQPDLSAYIGKNRTFIKTLSYRAIVSSTLCPAQHSLDRNLDDAIA